MTTINPCPFCGLEDVEIMEVRPGEFAVDCPECECIGPITPDVMDTIAAWNKAPQSQYNKRLLAALKSLTRRVTLDDASLRHMMAYPDGSRQGNAFDDLYQPVLDVANMAISEAEAACN